MSAATSPPLWTYSASAMGWVGDVRRPIVFAWDAATPARVAVLLVGREPLWLDRADASQGLDGPVGDWMWLCSRDGEPHVTIRPLVGDLIVVRRELLGRFLAATEFWVASGREDFETEAAVLLGGRS